MEPRVKRKKTPEQALATLMNTCAKMERSEWDVQQSLYRWEIDRQEWPAIIERLRRDKFIDNERYAMAFVREKLNCSGWGRYKILQGLRAKRIDAEVVNRVMEAIDEGDQEARLGEIISRKARTVKAKDSRDLRDKLMRFGLSRGYDYEMVQKIIHKITNCDEFDD